jgi:DNA-binding PadR family transcriptional regulator
MTQENEIKIQNFTRFYALVLLKSKKSITGYYILKKLKSDLKKNASPTYVYDFLKALKKRGYIEETKSLNTKKSAGYQLTSDGKVFTEKIFLRFNNLIEGAIGSNLKVCTGCGITTMIGGDLSGKRGIIIKIGDKEMNFCCKYCAQEFKNSKLNKSMKH